MRRLVVICVGLAYIVHGRRRISIERTPRNVVDTSHAFSSILFALSRSAPVGRTYSGTRLYSKSLTRATPHRSHSFMGNRLASRGLVMSEIHSDKSSRTDKVKMVDRMAVELEVDEAGWSPAQRNIFLGVALAGALLTVSLTLDKTLLSTFCTNEDCGGVIGGPYGNVAGIPLTLFGAVAYITAAVLAFLQDRSSFRLQVGDIDLSVRQLLLTVVTGMATFSAYLMILLGFWIEASCTYCILSAVFSASLCALAWWSSPSSDASLDTGKRAAVFGVVGALVHFFAGFENDIASEDAQKPKRAPEITTKSSDRALDIAKRLKPLNATMYGAYWCSHCIDQKNTLGKQAMSMLRYVECAEDAINSQSQFCEEIGGYPTWIINGETFRGEQSLEELEEIIGRSKQ